jgi:hypothetical protein
MMAVGELTLTKSAPIHASLAQGRATDGTAPVVRLLGEVTNDVATLAASVAIPAETMRSARADCHDGIRARVRQPRLVFTSFLG